MSPIHYKHFFLRTTFNIIGIVNVLDSFVPIWSVGPFAVKGIVCVLSLLDEYVSVYLTTKLQMQTKFFVGSLTYQSIIFHKFS